MRKWTLLLMCSLVFLGRPCRADEEYEGARGAAKRVIELVKAKKDEELKKFAAEPGEDPWLIVDALLEAQANDAAKAYAAAHEGKDAEALRAVAARGLKEPSDARARLAAAEAALAAPTPEDGAPEAIAKSIVASLKGGESIPDGVLRVRWLQIRARALERVGSIREQAADLGLASEIARKAGWTRRAAMIARESAEASRDDQDLSSALDAWNHFSDMQHALGDRSGEALGLMNSAEISRRFGETSLALTRIEEAMRVIPTGEAAAAARAKIRARRGALLAASGEIRRGYAELLAATQLLGNLDQSGLGDALIDLGNLQLSLGDFPGARRSFERALTAYEASDASDFHQARAKAEAISTAKASLASTSAYEGKYQESYDAYKAQRESFQEANDRGQAARALQGMAESRLRQAAETSDRDDRIHLLEKSRADAMNAASESRDVNDPESVLRANGTYGEAEERLNHLPEAIRKYEDVVREARDRLLFDIVLEYSVALARTRLSLRNWAGAIDAVEGGFRGLADTFGDLGDQARIQARAQHAELFDVGMRAALELESGEGIPLFFRLLEAGRAAALLDALENRDVLRARRIPPGLELARANAARIAMQRRNDLAIVGDRVADIREAEKMLRSAQEEYERAVDAIQQSAREGSSLLYPQPITLVDAQKRLELDEALVLYAVVGEAAFALLVTRGVAHLTPLGPATAACDICRKTLIRDGGPDSAAAWRDAAEKIWAPVLKNLPARVTMVYVSPDGNLGLLPFPALSFPATRQPPALPTPDAKSLPVPLPPVVERSFSFVPSASALTLLRETSGPRGVGTIAVGISEYSALRTTTNGSFRGRGVLANLRSAEDEVREVGTGIGNIVLVGKDATEDAVLNAIGMKSAWSAIHFAVHGLTDSRNPSLASLALAPSPTNDGDLTAFEIFQHDIPADVAVLAACDSAAGGYVRGEGLVGLVRAFIFAGCPRVIANLWNADDDAARAFSVAFHKQWRTGVSLSAAMEAARSSVRKNSKWKDPFYWAGWCAWSADTVQGPR